MASWLNYLGMDVEGDDAELVALFDLLGDASNNGGAAASSNYVTAMSHLGLGFGNGEK